MTRTTIVVLAGLTFLAAACEKKSPPPPAAPAPTTNPAPTTPPAAPSTPAPAGNSVSALGVNFTVPAGWQSAPPSNSMRLAEINVPDASGDPAKACLIVFSTAGGSVQSNMDRWAGQVADASGAPSKGEVKTRDIAGLKVSTAEFTGSYAGMGDGPAKENWMLRGAIIEAPEGLLFIKMTGPAEQMSAAGPAFNTMIDNLSKR
ncbi:hypothetical protein PHYC_00739 [Phycisphaerales bacterium]|nr:hypothetical protein PHYC_00739 [Phycisphaerales bacterium]